MTTPLVERLKATADWNDKPWWWDAPEKTFGDNGSPASLLAEAAEQIELLESIVRKIVRGDPQGQAYFDIENGVVDVHCDFTDEEATYLRRIQAEFDAEDDTGLCTCDNPAGSLVTCWVHPEAPDT